MKIINILDKAKYEVPHMTQTNLGLYVKDLSHSASYKTRPIIKTSELTLINNKEVHGVSLDIKKGNLHSLTNVYELKTVPKDLELKTLKDVKELPAYHYGVAERYTNTMTDNIKKKSPPGSLDHLETGTADLTMKDLDTSPALKDTVSSLQGKKLLTVAGKFVVIGIGLAVVVQFLNEHRKDMMACVAFRYTNGTLFGCKIPMCTCIDASMNERDNVYTICKGDILNLLPPEMTNVTNCQGNSGLKCVNCPSQSFRDMYGNDDTPLDEVSKRDQIYIECRIPSIFNALGDITHGVGEQTLDIIKGAASATSWLLKNLPAILIGGACLFGLAIAVWFLKSLGVFGGGKNSDKYVVNNPRVRTNSNYAES